MHRLRQPRRGPVVRAVADLDGQRRVGLLGALELEAEVAAARALTYQAANEIQQLVIARVPAKEAQGREPLWPECMPGAEGVTTGQGGDGAARSEEQVGTPA